MSQTRLRSLRPGGRSGHGISGYSYGYKRDTVPPSGYLVNGGTGGGTTATTVTVSNPGIDQEFVPVGCTYDASTLLRTGRVFLKNVIGEDGTGETETFLFLADNGTATTTYVPATHGPYVDCEDEPVQFCEQLCDDVAGDGSNIVTYYFIRRRHDTLGLTVDVGTFEDQNQQTAYTPVNPTTCDSIGVAAVRKEGRVEISGGTWSPTPLTVSYTVRVATVANTGTPPTFTDSFGNVTSFEAGESQTFDHGDDLLSDGLAVVTAQTGDRIIISYIETGV